MTAVSPIATAATPCTTARTALSSIRDSPNGNACLLVTPTPATSASTATTTLDADFRRSTCTIPWLPRRSGAAVTSSSCSKTTSTTATAAPPNPIPGDAAGHNLVAPGHGLAADATLTSAPGGTFPASRHGLHQLPRSPRQRELPLPVRRRPRCRTVLHLHQRRPPTPRVCVHLRRRRATPTTPPTRAA